MEEFQLIEMIRKITKNNKESLFLKDDLAKIDYNFLKTNKDSLKEDIVITKDLLKENLHFHSFEKAKNIAHKIIASNLSDIASSGGKPYYFLLGIEKSQQSQIFWQEFFDEVEKLQKKFKIKLIGGDIINSNNLSFSVTMIGKVAHNKNLSCTKAKNNQLIWVSGNIGSSYLGLQIINAKNNLPNNFQNFFKEKNDNFLKNQFFQNLIDSYLFPKPRIKLGQKLINYKISRAATDISDGLLADINKLAQNSNLVAEIFLDKIPLSKSAQFFLNEVKNFYQNNSQEKFDDKLNLISGGDDYELVFTASSNQSKKIINLSKELRLKITPIGIMKNNDGTNENSKNLILYKNNSKKEVINYKNLGYFHQ